MTLLTVHDLDVVLGGTTIVEGVAFDARAGELVGLIGPNGAGKSTVVRAVARLLTPARGGVAIDGTDVRRLRRRDLARRLAYLPQGHTVNWPVVVEHLVGLGRLPHARPLIGSGPRDCAAVRAAMDQTQTLHLGARVALTLSGGERARVMLARALAVEAAILLADEPVAQLDPYHQLRVMELMREIARGGDLVLCVLHDLPLAARFCDRLVLMDAGRVVAVGEPGEVLAQENLGAAYGVVGHHGEHEDEAYVLPWRRRLADAS
ncbi:MAG: ATP-binding cassette domain-containing protein [Deinococcus-Thermus bacterium]|nr:ATP-binding cassette domain-containing protein [Deinococcota bacterium]